MNTRKQMEEALEAMMDDHDADEACDWAMRELDRVHFGSGVVEEEIMTRGGFLPLSKTEVR